MGNYIKPVDDELFADILVRNLDAPELIVEAKDESTVEITVGSVPLAESYRLERQKGDDTTTIQSEVVETGTFRVSGLETNNLWQFRLVAVGDGTNTVDSDPSERSVRLVEGMQAFDLELSVLDEDRAIQAVWTDLQRADHYGYSTQRIGESRSVENQTYGIELQFDNFIPAYTYYVNVAAYDDDGEPLGEEYRAEGAAVVPGDWGTITDPAFAKMCVDALNKATPTPYEFTIPSGNQYLVLLSAGANNLTVEEIQDKIKEIEGVRHVTVIANGLTPNYDGFTPTLLGTNQIKYTVK